MTDVEKLVTQIGELASMELEDASVEYGEALTALAITTNNGKYSLEIKEIEA